MNDEEKQLHIRMPKDIYRKLKVKCIFEDTSMQEYVAKLVATNLATYSVNEEAINESITKGKKRKR